jgi:signal transduction histidine kinase
MSPIHSQLGPLAGLLAVLLTVASLSVVGRHREHKGLDLAMTLGLLAWMVFLAWQHRFAPKPPGPIDEFIEHMGYQLCVAAACKLALVGTHIGGRIPWITWISQVAGGGTVLLIWTWTGQQLWFDVWEVTNWLIVGAMVGVLLLRWKTHRQDRSPGILGLSLVLLAYCLAADLWHHPTSRLAVAGMFIYPAALVGLWSLVAAQMRSRAGLLGHSLGEQQRQRIAQDVHDGVGSQLVSILSSLDLRNPDQQALALSLEQCLLDLKITVDTLQQESPCLVEGLAMLRYRLQPSLTRLGVELTWDIEDHPAFDALPPLQVTHSLRIAQEAAANVLRHSGASRMTIACRYLDKDNLVELQMNDNGRGLGAFGMEPAPPAVRGARGRGLIGMRRRAQEAGLDLSINSAPDRGTSVRVRIPAPVSTPLAMGMEGRLKGWSSG